MLAQNFKTAADLGISEDQHRDLIRTLGRMERAEITDDRFIMWNVGSPDCGTAGCILGWARGRNGNPVWGTVSTAVSGRPALERLFLPHHCRGAYSANVEQAAMALRSYLTTGEPDWETAISSSIG